MDKSIFTTIITATAVASVVCLLAFGGYFLSSNNKIVDDFNQKQVNNFASNLTVNLDSILPNNLKNNGGYQIQSPCQTLPNSYLDENCKNKIAFATLDENAQLSTNGNNFVAVFDSKSAGLGFKVNVGLEHNLYQKENGQKNAKTLKKYQAKTFETLISEPNAMLDNKPPLLAINSDYIDPAGSPQGYNVSRGVSYSGDFATKRSSFAISVDGVPSIQIGPRKGIEASYNAVGGNGRFLDNRKFVDICDKLGISACYQETARSMVVITQDKNQTEWVMLLVHRPNTSQQLIPSSFQDFLGKISDKFEIGQPVDGMLFDGGSSPAIMYDQITYQQGFNPIGSVFLVYAQ